MRILGSRTLLGPVGFLAVGALGYALSLLTATQPVSAQIDIGEYGLYQPQVQTPVGRAWSNATHTIEYWAYIVGDYKFANGTNVAGNRWHLDAQRLSSADYPTFDTFKAAVLSSPEMAGKTVLFQIHNVTEQIVLN